MNQSCWQLHPDRGFLIAPDPIEHISAHVDESFPVWREPLQHIEHIADTLPTLLESGSVRHTLEALPIYDMSALNDNDDTYFYVERLMQMYSYFASAFVYATHQPTTHRIPAGVAVPLVQLASMVERPPILSYSGYVLNNWRRGQADGGIVVDDLRLNQQFLGNKDEAWFILIHVDIEARAADALNGILRASDAVHQRDTAGVEAALGMIYGSVERMMTTFHRMPEDCDSDVYYFKVRPYIFGFNDVVYEGVSAYEGKPVSFRGQTGAQSSIVPALVAALGIQHEHNELTHHLDIMKAYMPKPHREFIERMHSAGIREYVIAHTDNTALVEVYNQCLRGVLEFRKLHYHYATVYIFEKVTNPVGTGGTLFMDWLGRLIHETEMQLV